MERKGPLRPLQASSVAAAGCRAPGRLEGVCTHSHGSAPRRHGSGARSHPGRGVCLAPVRALSRGWFSYTSPARLQFMWYQCPKPMVVTGVRQGVSLVPGICPLWGCVKLTPRTGMIRLRFARSRKVPSPWKCFQYPGRLCLNLHTAPPNLPSRSRGRATVTTPPTAVPRLPSPEAELGKQRADCEHFLLLNLNKPQAAPGKPPSARVTPAEY